MVQSVSLSVCGWVGFSAGLYVARLQIAIMNYYAAVELFFTVLVLEFVYFGRHIPLHLYSAPLSAQLV